MPANIDITVKAEPVSIAQAARDLVDTVTQCSQRRRQARIENDAREHAMTNAAQEHARRELDLEEQELALASHRLDLQKKTLEQTLAMAQMVLDTLYPDVDEPAQRAALMREIVPALLQRQDGAPSLALPAAPSP